MKRMKFGRGFVPSEKSVVETVEILIEREKKELELHLGDGFVRGMGFEDGRIN